MDLTLLRTIYEMLQLQVTGLPFLFLILPVLLVIYYAMPVRLRPAILLAASLCLYYTGGHSLPLMLFSVLTDYLLQLLVRFGQNEKIRKLLLGVSAVKTVALLVWSGMRAELYMQPQVLGLAVYTLCGTGCVWDVYRKEIPCEKNLIHFSLYCCFFAKLYAGPLLPYNAFADRLGEQPAAQELLAGAGQFIEGLFKVAVLGGGLYALFGSASALPGTALAAWLAVFAFAFAFYYVLSGFSDIAQGLGALFGIRLPHNFYYPYQSQGVEDFVSRFNSSVSRFLQGIFPQNRQQDKLMDGIRTLVVCSLWGMWFGVSLKHLFWGGYLAVFILMERYLYPKLMQNIPTLFCRLGTLCVVLAGFTLLMGETPFSGIYIVRDMFRFGNLFDTHVLYLLSTNWLLIVISCFFATSLVNRIFVRLRRVAPVMAMVLFGAADAVILVFYIALQY